MKKKTALGILGAGLIIPTAFGLAGCSHDHKASAEWTMDSNNHWHVCSEKDCNEKVGVENHETRYITGVGAGPNSHGWQHKECADCGYKISGDFITVHAPKIETKITTTGTEGSQTSTTRYQISCGDESCKEYYVQGTVVAKDMTVLDDHYVGTSAIKVPYTSLGNDIISFGGGYIAKVTSDKKLEPYEIPAPADGNGVTKYTYTTGEKTITLNVKGNYATVSGNDSSTGLFNGLNGTIQCSIDKINDSTSLLIVSADGINVIGKIGDNNALTLLTSASEIVSTDADETAKAGTVYTLTDGTTYKVYTQNGKSYCDVQNGDGVLIYPCKVGTGTLEVLGTTFKVTTTKKDNKTTNTLSVEKKGTKKYQGTSILGEIYFNVVDGKNVAYLETVYEEASTTGNAVKKTAIVATGEWEELEDRVVVTVKGQTQSFGYTIDNDLLAMLYF